MKLEPKAKPVRIRIKSGGEEHFSLESLKRNFSVQDLWEAVRGKSLSQWLRQQKDNDLAEKVDTFSQIEKPSGEDYIKFSCLFFEKEMADGNNDANTLVKFYLDNNLMKNFQNAISCFLPFLDYKYGKKGFDLYKDLKTNQEWITYFDTQLTHIKGEEVIECYQFLSKLHFSINDVTKMKYYQSEAQAHIVSLAKKDKSIMDKWLNCGDYLFIRTMFEDEMIRNNKSDNDWIFAFRRCQESLSSIEKGKCLYLLYTLYIKTNNEKDANDCLKMSAKYGCLEAKSKITPPSKYPQLTKIRESYGEKITIKSFRKIKDRLLDLVGVDGKGNHYRNCMHCLGIYENIVDDSYCKTVMDAENRIRSITNHLGIDAEIPLIYVVASLAWEEKQNGSKTMYRNLRGDSLPFDYRNIFNAKIEQKEAVVKTEDGLECNLATDSLLDQAFFFMENYGAFFSFEYKN